MPLIKAWVLGNSRFKQQIERETGRRASPLAKGGDRKSINFLSLLKINNSDLLIADSDNK